MVEYSEIQEFAETYYQIEVKKIFQLTHKLYRLTTNEHDYLLKFATGDDEFIMKQLFAYKVLPQNVKPIYRTKDKEYDVKLADQFVYLTDYIQIIPVPLEKQVHYYIDLLKKLHKETELVVDVSEEEISTFHDKEYQILQASYGKLQKSIEAFELKLDRSPYEWYFMMVYPMLYGMLHQANGELKKFYDLLKKDKKLPTCLIHGDVNVANVLVSEKLTYLINFEKSDFSLAPLDIYRFLQIYHQVPGVNSIIFDYIKNEKSEILRRYFFFKCLCIDLSLLESLSHSHSLEKIALLNEIIAPCLLTMQIYEQYHRPPPEPEKKNPLQELMKN